ncbi:HK97 family phage prohead protease [Bradyrhizobium elkanii]
MSSPDASTLERFRRRIKGERGARVHWSSEDIHRIAKRYGLRERDIDRSVVELPRRKFAEIQQQPTSVTGADYTATLSTARVDRMFDSIAVGGWDLKEFRRNPVVLLSHDSQAMPVAKASAGVWIGSGKLKGAITLAPDQDELRKLIDGGFLTAISVGFRPGKWKFSEDKSRPYGIDFQDGHELLEFSLVSIPANPDALIDRAIVQPTSASSGKSADALERQRERERTLRNLRLVR